MKCCLPLWILPLWILLLTAAAVPAQAPLDESPLPIELVRAYPNIRVRRPVVITNAHDGSNRLFVATQQGVVNVFPADQNATEERTFLDIEDKVVYSDAQNEEGLLGLAFHPEYSANGYFYLYYTTRETPQTSVISRFSVSKDPNQADPDSELELLRISQPFWNHNGGTLEFGPDGFLYIALGDGGLRNDTLMNGQNVQTLLGAILRIDVDHPSEIRAGRRVTKLNYSIPQDNPFADAPEFARGEIFAYGFRNPWRISFDKKTGDLWAADVGQDTWEEIDIVKKGGNYGWNLREGKHKFGPAGSEPRSDLIEPVWEYHHDVGKSITGGNVYRGQKVPELDGYYLYADYVSMLVWGLKADPGSNKVLANRPITGAGQPIITFGYDENGEVYCSDPSGMLYQFRKKSP
jgi:quinoprotein glucose dehydrogenase